ncbi:hypothetical protein Tco_1411263, partial [Tanacetum coccineum]
VWSHYQSSREAGVLNDISGDEGLYSGGTKLNSILITDEVTFTKPKRAEKENLNKQQPKPTTPPTTPIITTTTTQIQSPFPQSLPKGSSQTEGEHIKKDKGKKALSSEEATKESTGSDSDDDEIHLSRSMVESSRIKKVKKFDFVTEEGKHIHLTEEQINQQKKIEEEAKAEVAKCESKVRKEELIDLLGPEVVNKYQEELIDLLGPEVKVYKAGKGLLYVKRKKAISLGNATSRVVIEVHQLSLKDCTCKVCVGIKRLLDDLRVTAVKVLVTVGKYKSKGQSTAKSKGQSTAKSKGQSTACLVWKSRSTAFNIGTLKD